MTLLFLFVAPSDLGGSKDTMVFEAFLRLFVETTGHHTEYICTQQDGQSVFEVTTSAHTNTHTRARARTHTHIPYSPVFETHHFVLKLSTKTWGGSYTWVEVAFVSM